MIKNEDMSTILGSSSQSNLNMLRNKDIDKIFSVSRQNSLQYYQKWQNLRHLDVNMKIWTRLSSKLWRSVHLLSKNWIYKHDSRYKVHSKRWVNIEEIKLWTQVWSKAMGDIILWCKKWKHEYASGFAKHTFLGKKWRCCSS